MEYEQITFEVVDRVATITMNRPDRMNAWTWRMGAEMSHAYGRCDEDDDVRAVIVTGAGRAYCAGADFAAGADTFSGGPEAGAAAGDSAPPPPRREWYPFEVRKPVIAAINGHAIGVGMTLSMQCDVRFVAEDAKLAFAFVRRGVIPELGSHNIVARVAGLSNAADVLLSGRTFSGAEAAAMGLASTALPADEVLDHARAYARDIAVHTAPASVAISKRLIWEGLGETPPETMAKEHRLFGWVGRQADAGEGVMAFLEKREPTWSLSPGDVRWPT